MGEELTTDALPPLTIDVAGTAAIERLIVRRDTAVVGTRELWEEDREHPDRYRLTWCGTRAHGSSHAQALDWTGRLRPSRGTLALVAAVGFYCDEDSLTTDGEAISFRSVTAGNRVGFLFDAPDDGGGHVSLESNRVVTDFALPRGATLRHELPQETGAGFVALSRAPDPNGGRDHRLEMELPDIEPSGTHAYWVEVVQVDGHRAWSSPIFVTPRTSRARARSGSGARG